MQVGINPTMAVYTIVLGGACAVAAYSERYRRDQDDIDDRLKERYSTTMKEQQAKIPQITQAIRGQDRRLDGTMNQWVWGGKAALPVGGPTGRGYQARVQGGVPTHEESDSGKATQQQQQQEEVAVVVEDESQLSRKERKRRRKERKELKRQQEQEAEQRRWETQRQKLVVQSVAAGATIGAVAVAASIFLGNNTRK